VRDVGPFRLYLWPRPEPFYRNRAIAAGPSPPDWGPAVAGLLAAFAAANREPRTESFPELRPGLAEALEAAGLRREAEAPAMALAAADGPSSRGATAGAVRILDAATPPTLLEAFLCGVQAAFGAPPAPDPGELAQLRRDLAEGATLAAAWLEDGGRPVAGACLIGLGPEAELAGVWTDARHRRRGLATAVCAALLRRFFAAAGELAWLSAAGEGSEALYRRLGFARVGTQLNHGPHGALPPSAP
jgi:GNAT superfamily N-acetyltransferase